MSEVNLKTLIVKETVIQSCYKLFILFCSQVIYFLSNCVVLCKFKDLFI